MGPTLLCELGLFLLCTLLCTGHAQDAVLTIEPNWSSFFIGEFVTFMCDMNEGADTDWYYKLNKDGQEFVPYNTHKEYRLQITSTGDSGEYQCFGRRKSSNYTKSSNTVSVTVSADKPRATLTAGTTIIPVGGSVTLTCSVGSSAEWKYEWFRHTHFNSRVQIRRDDQPNRVIRVSQGGIYSCRGRRGDPVYYTDISDEVSIEITFSNKVAVKQQHKWPQIFSGETITLTCEVQEGGEPIEWVYQWKVHRQTERWTQYYYSLTFRVSESSSGDYMCKSRRRDDPFSSTEWSEAFTLSVTNGPRPVLTVSPSWLSPGASVTLNCEVEHPSAGWSFYWYKAVPDLSEKSYSYELLPDGSGTAQDSYIIDGQTHTAGYVCIAGRGDPEYHTDHSEPKFVWSADVHSAASLTVSPDRVQHFIHDSVSLTCEGNSAEWRVRKLSEDGRLTSDCWPMTGSTCNINTSQSDTAVYWCEFGSGEFSKAVNITVQDDPDGPILVSPVHPVTEGASVRLSCSLRTQKIFSNVFFYHNNKLIQNDTREELNISAVSKSDEGFYKCEYSGRESPQSWMLVKAVSSLQSPLFLILVIVGLISGIIFIFLLFYKKCKGSAEDQSNVSSLIHLKVINKPRQHCDPEESSKSATGHHRQHETNN